MEEVEAALAEVKQQLLAEGKTMSTPSPLNKSTSAGDSSEPRSAPSSASQFSPVIPVSSQRLFENDQAGWSWHSDHWGWDDWHQSWWGYEYGSWDSRQSYWKEPNGNKEAECGQVASMLARPSTVERLPTKELPGLAEHIATLPDPAVRDLANQKLPQQVDLTSVAETQQDSHDQPEARKTEATPATPMEHEAEIQQEAKVNKSPEVPGLELEEHQSAQNPEENKEPPAEETKEEPKMNVDPNEKKQEEEKKESAAEETQEEPKMNVDPSNEKKEEEEKKESANEKTQEESKMNVDPSKEKDTRKRRRRRQQP